VVKRATGPTNGEPVEMGLIIAGADPGVVDTVATRVMGVHPLYFGHIRMANEYGIGTYEDIEVVGDFQVLLIKGSRVTLLPFIVSGRPRLTCFSGSGILSPYV